jgi:hypothetical protein
MARLLPTRSRFPKPHAGNIFDRLWERVGGYHPAARGPAYAGRHCGVSAAASASHGHAGCQCAAAVPATDRPGL